jgi:renalase
VKVLVVGAGMTGLAAARALQAGGHAVVVFEKGRRPGGRIATRRILDGEADRPELSALAFDHGAQYFTVRDTRFMREVEAWHRDRIVQVWNGKLAAFDSEGREPVEDEETRWVGVPGMDAVARHLARGLDIHCGVEAVSMEPNANGWEVTVLTGLRESFDAVLLGVPAPQAVPLLAALPQLAREAAAVRMHPCWATLAAFDARVPTAFDAAFVDASPLGWVARDRSKPQRGLAETWVLHASAAWSEAHAGDRADTVGPFLLNAFADLVRGPLPLPVHLTALRWRYAAAAVPLARGALVDRDRRLVVCGDWLLGSRIEAAFLSGLAGADALRD